MNKLLSLSMCFLLCVFSHSAYACFPAKVSLENRVKQSSQIAVGYVTGQRLTQFEEQVGAALVTIQPNDEFTLRVKVTENIKSQFKSDIINPVITNCGSGSGQLKQKVFVFYDGEYWFVTAFEQEMFNQLNILVSNQ